jgi:hypothetical protein
VAQLRAALEESWQKRRSLESELASLRAEAEQLRVAARQAPTELAAEREELRRQIDDLLALKVRLVDELQAALERVSGSRTEQRATAHGSGRVLADPEALERVYGGRVSVAAQPLADFAGISALERSLVSLPSVADVHVRRLDGATAVLELELLEPAPLLRDLDGALPFDVEVAAADDETITLAVRP